MAEYFKDRYDAGQRLAKKLAERMGDIANPKDAIVLALPRGGVPVAFEVARTLNLPMDVFLVRKLGVPGQEELAMGAIASGGVVVLNQDVVNYLGISREIIDFVAERERKELQRRDRLYRGLKPAPNIAGHTVVLVDDGLATGSTMRAAVSAVRQQGPSRIVIAVPVAPPSTVMELRTDVDDVVCVLQPEPFEGVGRWYEDFSQTSDDEVRCLLGLSNHNESGCRQAIA